MKINEVKYNNIYILVKNVVKTVLKNIKLKLKTYSKKGKLEVLKSIYIC